MLSTWRKSTGASAERDFALNHGKEVFYTIEALDAWLAEAL
jgi:hypothetical protein